jgi:hypothetical protein
LVVCALFLCVNTLMHGSTRGVLASEVWEVHPSCAGLEQGLCCTVYISAWDMALCWGTFFFSTCIQMHSLSALCPAHMGSAVVANK